MNDVSPNVFNDFLDNKKGGWSSLFTQFAKLGDFGAWHLDARTYKLSWFEETRCIFGVSADSQPTLEAAIDFYHPEDRDLIAQAVNKCLEEGEGWDLKLRIYNQEGLLRWTRSLGEAMYEGDTIISVFGLIHDFTKVKEIVDENHKLDVIRSFVSNGTASLIGENFLKNLTENLGVVMKAKCVFVASLDNDSTTASTIALWLGGEFVGNMSYESPPVC